jgi:catechol 2,3-dioxygenase-like lactoylglutathione lyase family enzyme
MVSGIVGFAHVKLPVSDVERSARWYAALLDLRLCLEFVEQGVLLGVELVEPGSGLRIALRDRSVCAGSPHLAGFDVVAIEMGSAEGVRAMADRCARTGVEILGIRDFPGGTAMDVPDPDGTVVRIHHASGRPPFLGVETGPDGELSAYPTPRLTGVPPAE